MGHRRERGQSRAVRLARRRKQHRRRNRRIAALAVAALAVGIAGAAYAAVSQVTELWTCVDASGVARNGWTAYQRTCPSGQQAVGMSVHGPPPSTVTTTTAAATTTTTRPATTTTTAPPASGEVQMPGVYLTSYGWPDNNPPNSATICCASVHSTAGGTGTVADPLTIAASNGSAGSGLQFAPGTRFYVPNVRAYFVVEDALGTAAESPVHLDMWAGGNDGSSASSTLACENAVTGHYLVVRNPASSYAVVPGALVQHGVCRQQFGDALTAAGGATTTTTSPTTTTTAPTGGSTIVPTGPACPSSTASSTYQGNTLTVTQAVQALYGGGFRTMADLRMFVGIGRAESSLCVRTWHYHPTQSCPGFPQPCADRGWLQINDSFWPQFPDAQVLDPVGAAQAARSIVYDHGGSYGTWDTAGTAANMQATVAQVCAAEPTTTGCP